MLIVLQWQKLRWVLLADFDLVFGVIMGTGVGGGIVINKKLHSGRTNIAGEWGHHTLHRNGNSLLLWKNWMC